MDWNQVHEVACFVLIAAIIQKVGEFIQKHMICYKGDGLF